MSRSPAAGRYLRFAAAAAAVCAGLGALGWVPTGRWGGAPAQAALAAGCAVSLVASLLSGLVIARSAGAPGAGAGGGAKVVQTALAAMGARLAAVAVLTAAAALLGGLPLKPLLLWVAISYAALLVVDTRYALGSAAGDEAGADEAGAE